MPTLTRFLVVLAFLGIVAYGTMFALVALVDPATREMSHPIAKERFER